MKLQPWLALIVLLNQLPAWSLPPQQGSVEQNQGGANSSFRLKRTTTTTNTANPYPAIVAPPLATPPVVETNSSVAPDFTKQFPTTAPAAATPIPPADANQAQRSSTTWRPGVILTAAVGSSLQEELKPYCDVNSAAQQAQQYPTSPEAAFIYAVALTRSSQVDHALKEVRRARNLAQASGNPDYFNSAVSQYEYNLQDDPNNLCIRYGLGWAYYMQAYLYAFKARNQVNLANRMAGQMPKKQNRTTAGLLGGAAILASALTGTRPMAGVIPRIPGALDDVPSWAEPQIRIYYQKCLNQMGEVVRRDPKDIWAAAYRAHVQEEFDGNHAVALAKLEQLKKAGPGNPAASFFLADAYARNGNFSAGINSFGDALKIRAGGK